MVVSQNEKSNTIRIFLDMDGTLAEYRDCVALTQFGIKNYYGSLKAEENLIEGIRLLLKKYPDTEIHILSACPYPSENEKPEHSAKAQKHKWLDENFPEIPFENRHLIYVGESKREAIPGGVRKTDVLIDDLSHNLKDYYNNGLGGTGIKISNGQNGRNHTWKGPVIAYDSSPEQIAKNLEKIIFDQELVREFCTEIQLRNDTLGQTIFIKNDDLPDVVKKLFPHKYTDVDDFRKNFNPDDWSLVKEKVPNIRIDFNVSPSEYVYSLAAYKDKISELFLLASKTLNDLRKNLVQLETEIKFYQYDNRILNLKKQELEHLKKEYNSWHDTIKDSATWYEEKKVSLFQAKQFANRLINEFFYKYQTASKTINFPQISFQKGKKELLEVAQKSSQALEGLFNTDLDKISNLNFEIENNQPDKRQNIGDDFFEI